MREDTAQRQRGGRAVSREGAFAKIIMNTTMPKCNIESINDSERADDDIATRYINAKYLVDRGFKPYQVMMLMRVYL